MKRYDLRHLRGGFITRMGEIIRAAATGEVMIFLFEMSEDGVTQSARIVRGLGSTLLNSLPMTHGDWMIVVKKGR